MNNEPESQGIDTMATDQLYLRCPQPKDGKRRVCMCMARTEISRHETLIDLAMRYFLLVAGDTIAAIQTSTLSSEQEQEQEQEQKRLHASYSSCLQRPTDCGGLQKSWFFVASTALQCCLHRDPGLSL
jgi:hypothetical protein